MLYIFDEIYLGWTCAIYIYLSIETYECDNLILGIYLNRSACMYIRVVHVPLVNWNCKPQIHLIFLDNYSNIFQVYTKLLKILIFRNFFDNIFFTWTPDEYALITGDSTCILVLLFPIIFSIHIKINYGIKEFDSSSKWNWTI